LFGEPAKWVVKEIANVWDFYSTSPQDEGHKAFKQRVDEYGKIFEDITKKAIAVAEEDFSKLIGTTPPLVFGPPAPKSMALKELYERRQKIRSEIAKLDSYYGPRIQALKNKYYECLRRIRDPRYCADWFKKYKPELKRLENEYHSKRAALYKELQKINELVALVE